MDALINLIRPLIWELSRKILNFSFGLYKSREKVLGEWKVLEDNPTILDIGCGSGQYAAIAKSSYLGLDLEKESINHAQRKYGDTQKTFECADVTISSPKSQYDVVLMVDFLHHLTDSDCIRVLTNSGNTAKKYIINFEPVLAQDNPLGRWFVDHDRGDYVRTSEDLEALYKAAGLQVIKKQKLKLGPIMTDAILCLPISN